MYTVKPIDTVQCIQYAMWDVEVMGSLLSTLTKLENVMYSALFVWQFSLNFHLGDSDSVSGTFP